MRKMIFTVVSVQCSTKYYWIFDIILWLGEEMFEKSKLLLLFEKPLEPFFTPKEDGKVEFNVPSTHKTERYDDMIYRPPNEKTQVNSGVARLVAPPPQDNTDKKVITIEDVNLPDLSFATVLKRTSQFSLFNETHVRIAAQLTKIFMDADSSSLFAIASYARKNVNIFLFQYSYAVALQHRHDTSDIFVPNIVTLFPNHFVEGSAFPSAREELALYEETKRQVIEIPANYTAADKELEQRMAYFREDIAVNSHHWHWHLVYPGFSDERDVHKIVDKDRRGELFYYMHNQMLRRYNVDRINNNLPLTEPLNNFRAAIPEGYYPKLVHSGSYKAFPPRHSNCFLSDVRRPKDFTMIEIRDLERWSDRIYHAIDQGFVVDKNGKQISLEDDKGINVLGNVIESTALSPNPQLYGNLHNQGHNIISFAHDPDGKYMEDGSVMSMFETALRDPIFFRWHAFIEDIFARHKENLPQYDPQRDFIYDEITVTSVEVRMNSEPDKKNILKTYWQKSIVVLTNGLDFAGVAGGDVFATYIRLQHCPFTYTIEVENMSSVQRFGTCRIFMCPVSDGRNHQFGFEEQRKLMIEMDRFKVTLNQGKNTITRRSDESSVTMFYDNFFSKKLGDNSPFKSLKDIPNKFCACGWPQHMLLPKGTMNGAPYNVFVMISNYDQDKIDQPDNFRDCDEGSSFCGLKDRKYPDRRPMGFPFDRPYKYSKKEKLTDASKLLKDLSDFVQLGKNNMFLQQFKIQFCDEVIEVGEENVPRNNPKCQTINWTLD